MDKFLRNIHSRPDHHKKSIAFFTSGAITLFIFGIWALVNFGVSDSTVIAGVEESQTDNKSNEVSPFEAFKSNVAASIGSIGDSFNTLKKGVESVNLESEYVEMRDGAMEVYGQ